MLHLILIFLLIAVLAGMLGNTEIAYKSSVTVKVLFGLFVAFLAAKSLAVYLRRKRNGKRR